MIAIDPPVRFLIFPLASKGPSTHAPTPVPGTEPGKRVTGAGSRATSRNDMLPVAKHSW
jgi:hypothetical protein